MMRIDSQLVVTFSIETNTLGELSKKDSIIRFGDNLIDTETNSMWVAIYENPLQRFAEKFHRIARVTMPIDAIGFVVGHAIKAGDDYELVEPICSETSAASALAINNLIADIINAGFFPIKMMGNNWSNDTNTFGIFDFANGFDHRYIVALEV